MSRHKKADLAATRPAKESEHLDESSDTIKAHPIVGRKPFFQPARADHAGVDTLRDDQFATLERANEILQQYELVLPRRRSS